MQTRQPRVYLLLALIVLLGLAIRLYELDKRTMTHVEIYVPGIPLPAGLADPGPRLNVVDTFRSLIGTMEPHPPGYYLLMLGWTRIFGWGIGWLRLPSVIFGTASILLVFILGRLENNTPAGLLAALLAALLVALNGHQVFWSQLARGYIGAAFFGLAATIFLLLALQKGKWERFYQLAYLAIVLLGVSFVVYFWPILIAQMLWVLVEYWRENKLPGIFQVQYLALLLGTPLISLAIFQSRRPSYLDSNFLPSLVGFLGFGYAVEYVPPSIASIPGVGLAPFLLMALGILFLAAGLSKARSVKDPIPSLGIPEWILLAVVPFVTLIIIAAGMFLAATYPQAGRMMVFSAALPLVLILLYFGLRYFWKVKHSGNQGTPMRSAAPGWNYRLSAYLAVIPILLVAAATPVSALFSSRGILLYSPYLLLVIAAGALALIRRSRLWLPVFLVILLILPIGGIFFRSAPLEHPTDYKGLAEKWIPQIQENDLIFVSVHWYTTPIYYYLDASKYRVVGELVPGSYTNAIQEMPDSRIWVLNIPVAGTGEALKQALVGYQVIETIETANLSVDLFTRPRAAP